MAFQTNINFNIVKENIKRPPASYDAYLYSYKNLDNNKKYLGVHKGAVNDQYNHTSKNEEFKIHLNDPEIPFEFSVLEYGSYNGMREIEHSTLTEAKILGTFKRDYYNIHTGQFKYKGPDLKKIKNLFNKITDVDENNEPLHFEIKKEDLSIHKDMERIQCRFRTIDKNNQKQITEKLIASKGDTSNCAPVVVFEGEYPEDDRRGNGTHTVTSCVASKIISEIPVMRVPYELHKHLTELERKRVCSLLNKPSEIVKKDTDYEDIAKDLYDNYIAYGIEPDSVQNKEFMNEVGLSGWFQKKAIDKAMQDVAKRTLKNMNFIEWDADNDHKDELDKEVEEWNNKKGWCAFKCSSAAFKGYRPLELFDELSEAQHRAGLLDNPRDISKWAVKKCMIIMYHPNLRAERKWNGQEQQKDEKGKITQEFIESDEIKQRRRFEKNFKGELKIHFMQKDMWESDGTE